MKNKLSYNPYLTILYSTPDKLVLDYVKEKQTLKTSSGLNFLQELLLQACEYHHAELLSYIEQYAEMSIDYQKVYGKNLNLKMEYSDNCEYQLPLPQRVIAGITVGFPLKKIEAKFPSLHNLENITLGRLADLYLALFESHWKLINKELNRTFLTPINNLNYVDNVVDYKIIPVYALLNGDGKPIPISDEGIIFDSKTHTHFLASKNIDKEIIRYLYSNVMEHGIGSFKDFKILISLADKESFLTEMEENGKTAFVLFKKTEEEKEELKNTDITNRPNIVTTERLGLFDGIEVCVAPWLTKNHFVCVNLAKNSLPLVCRVLDKKQFFYVKNYSDNNFIETIYSYFGLGVFTRHGAAVVQKRDNNFYCYEGL